MAASHRCRKAFGQQFNMQALQRASRRRLVSLFVVFFLACQGFTLIFELPIGLSDQLPAFLHYMSWLDILVDLIVLLVLTSILHVVIAAVLAFTFGAASSLRIATHRRSTIYGVLLILFCYGILGTRQIWTALLAHWLVFVGPVASACSVLSAALLVLVAWRSGELGRLPKRLARIGLVFSLAILVLLPIPLIMGVRFAFGAHVHHSSTDQPAHNSRPNIVVVTLDALSASATSLYGAEQKDTPNLEEFAKHATTFDNLIAAGNFTTPTTTSLLSGLDISRHRVSGIPFYFEDNDGAKRNDMLPNVLRRNGYRTAAIVSNALANPIRTRLDAGFDDVITPSHACDFTGRFWLSFVGTNVFFTHPAITELDQLAKVVAKASCMGVAFPIDPPQSSYQLALQWIRSSDQTRPFLVWIHTMPPHDPYLPPPPFLQMYDNRPAYVTAKELRHAESYFSREWTPDLVSREDVAILSARYRENIRFADEELGMFLSQLRGADGNTIVVVTADHGEEFGRWLGHTGPYLDQELIHIPLVIAGPGVVAGRRISNPVSQIDIAPTLLELAGFGPPAQMQGRSLAVALHGAALQPKPVFSSSDEAASRHSQSSSGTYSVIADGWKYVQYLARRNEELFDLSNDPAATRDVSGLHRDIVVRLRALVDARYAPSKKPFAARKNSLH